MLQATGGQRQGAPSAVLVLTSISPSLGAHTHISHSHTRSFPTMLIRLKQTVRMLGLAGAEAA